MHQPDVAPLDGVVDERLSALIAVERLQVFVHDAGVLQEVSRVAERLVADVALDVSDLAVDRLEVDLQPGFAYERFMTNFTFRVLSVAFLLVASLHVAEQVCPRFKSLSANLALQVQASFVVNGHLVVEQAALRHELLAAGAALVIFPALVNHLEVTLESGSG